MNLNLRGKRQSKEQLHEGCVNGRLDMTKFGIEQQVPGCDTITLRQGAKDQLVWKPTGAGFTFKTAKALVRQQGGGLVSGVRKYGQKV